MGSGDPGVIPESPVRTQSARKDLLCQESPSPILVSSLSTIVIVGPDPLPLGVSHHVSRASLKCRRRRRYPRVTEPSGHLRPRQRGPERSSPGAASRFEVTRPSARVHPNLSLLPAVRSAPGLTAPTTPTSPCQPRRGVRVHSFPPTPGPPVPRTPSGDAARHPPARTSSFYGNCTSPVFRTQHRDRAL